MQGPNACVQGALCWHRWALLWVRWDGAALGPGLPLMTPWSSPGKVGAGNGLATPAWAHLPLPPGRPSPSCSWEVILSVTGGPSPRDSLGRDGRGSVSRENVSASPSSPLQPRTSTCRHRRATPRKGQDRSHAPVHPARGHVDGSAWVQGPLDLGLHGWSQSLWG